MVLLGYASALLMGLLLGLLGGGGSIFGVPILVYFFGLSPAVATGYALCVVGLTAFSGAFLYMRKGALDLRVLLRFAGPALPMVWFVRGYVVPSMPDVFWGVRKDTFLLVFFACVMMLSAYMMLRKKHITEKSEVVEASWLRMFLASVSVGALTGFAGAGGGFLITPALLAFFNLPMHRAVATSLGVIACNAGIGFVADLYAGLAVDLRFLAGFLTVTLLGMALGVRINPHVSVARLKALFGWIAFSVGFFMLVRETGFFNR